MSNNVLGANSLGPGVTEAGLSAWATAVAALFAGAAAFVAWHQLRAAARSAEASVFLEIHRTWNEIYPIYRRLVRENFDPDDVIQRHRDFATYAGTEEWKEKRRLFSFYEFCGTLVNDGHIREKVLFALVSYKPAIWSKYGPLIRYFREQDGGSDLYINWERLDRRYCKARRRKDIGVSGRVVEVVRRIGGHSPNWRHPDRELLPFVPKNAGAAFEQLAASRTNPIPCQRDLSDKKKAYRAYSLDLTTPAANEPLVRVADHGLLGRNFYSQQRNPPHYAPVPGAIDELWVREGVARRLSLVNERLMTDGLALWLFDAWRPSEVQAYFHDKWMPAYLKRHDPALEGDKLNEAVEKYWAAKTTDLNSPAPHGTGAAVDVTLCWLSSGDPLWMGSLFDDVSEISHTDYFEGEGKVGLSISNEEARGNRRLLHWVMKEADFCPHPDEWWHFSYGDQMWALLSGKAAGLYGGTQPPTA